MLNILKNKQSLIIFGFFISIYLISFNFKWNLTHTFTKSVDDIQCQLKAVDLIKSIKTLKLIRDNKSIINAPKLLASYPEPLEVNFFSFDNTSTNLLPRAFNEDQHRQYMDLIFQTGSFLGSHNISYMIYAGSAIGSWRHWDIIPWDDDFDMIVDAKDSKKLTALLKDPKVLGLYPGLNWTHGLNTYDFPLPSIKLFSNNSTRSFKRYKYTWPFVDIFFYTTDSYYLKYKYGYKNLIPLEGVFPLVLRPMGKYWLPAPAKPGIFQRTYGDYRSICAKSTWNHRDEKSQKYKEVKCKELYDDYPFVMRNCELGKCIETLIKNSTILAEIIF